ncbi:MAG TPA: Trm112 family protein [Ohtaekwangia sp.]|uniref:Trm112 family protein n=1 Tax=Ohtaekwangia sp. TaxID=2066019 RepID=UPI002F932793
MKISLLQKLACPFDKKDLDLKIFKQEEDNIIEGIFTCAHCNRYYPIVYGIPIMSPDEYREKTLELPVLHRWGLQLDGDTPTFRLLSAHQEVEK